MEDKVASGVYASLEISAAVGQLLISRYQVLYGIRNLEEYLEKLGSQNCYVLIS